MLLLALDFASERLPNEQSPIRGSSCDILTIRAVRGCRCVGCVCVCVGGGGGGGGEEGSPHATLLHTQYYTHTILVSYLCNIPVYGSVHIPEACSCPVDTDMEAISTEQGEKRYHNTTNLRSKGTKVQGRVVT